MDAKRFYQASIVDELAHLMEKPLNTSITQGWTFTLEGAVDSGAIREALDACLALYPKLRCTMTGDYPSFKRAYRYCWRYRENVAGSDIFREIEDPGPEHRGGDILACYTDYHASCFVDITRDTPIRVLLIRQADRSMLMFFVHHAAVDGIGFLIFFQSFITLYESILSGRGKGVLAAPDYEGISRPHMPFRWKHFLPAHLSVYLKHGVLKEQERVAYHGGADAGRSMEKLLAIARELTPDQFAALRTKAKQLQATINDYLLACMFRTVNTWNRMHQEPPGRIYLDVPVNLRTPEDRTIGNIMCGFRMYLPSAEVGNRDATLRAVREKRAFMMENNIPRKMVEFAWVLRTLPVQLKKYLYRQHPHSYYPTLTMSNIGICQPNPAHQDEAGFHYLGAARIRTMCFIGYAAPWPQLIALTYNNRMTISLSVFRSQFSREGAEQFLDTFIEEINRED